MKTLFTITLCMIVLISSAQSTYNSKALNDALYTAIDTNARINQSAKIFRIYNGVQPEILLSYKTGSDTIEIVRPDKIRFIKIWDRIYEIQSPALKEVVPINSRNPIFYNATPFTSTPNYFKQ